MVDTGRSRARILAVDDEPDILDVVSGALRSEGYEVITLGDPLAALDRVAQGDVDVAVLDIRMLPIDGLELLRRLKAGWPDLEVVMMTGHGTSETAFEAVKLGAFGWLAKPFEIDELIHVVGRAVERRALLSRNRDLEDLLARTPARDQIIGRAAATRRLFDQIGSAATTDAPVLVQGESGTGKELVARAIHRASGRREGPLVAVNCGAIPQELIAAELFGHKEGAFTNATSSRKGHFLSAEGGTILLDEIGEMPLAVQVHLLRVLQNREVVPVGESRPRAIDVRVIAATNVDLARAVDQGRFRGDLYWRLNVIPIRVPPLRERREDIPLLAHHFLKKYASEYGRPVREISPDALEALEVYDWAGNNIRELENTIASAVAWCQGPRLETAHLRPELRDEPGTPAMGRPSPVVSSRVRTDLPFADAKKQAITDFELSYVRAILEETSGNISLAARRAGLDRSNFRRVMARYAEELGELSRDTGDQPRTRSSR
jgi:DNA-binding NtrC family response regulator